MRFVLAALALAAGLARPAAGSGIHTLYTVPGAPARIVAFAQDGNEIAWLTPSRSGCNVVHVLDLRDGGHYPLPSQSSRNVTCHWPVVPPVGLALADASVLWTLHARTPLELDYVLGARLRDPGERRFQELAHGGHGAGLWLGGLAGGDGTLVYGVTAIGYADQLGCLAGTASCAMRRVGGGIYRVGRGQPQHVPGTSWTYAVAASSGAVASIPAAAVGRGGRPLPGTQEPVVVRDARTGRIISSVAPQATPVALALSPHVLALLERRGGHARIAWYGRTTGELRGTTVVPATTASELAANDQVVVFHVGRSIRAIDVADRKVRTLAHAASGPLGLSLAGSRLAWAENVGGRGRIRALYLSGQG